MKKKELYVCDTYYHLLIAIIKAIKSNCDSDLILASNCKNNSLLEDKNLEKRIKESKIFKNVLISNHSKEEITNVRRFTIFKRLLLARKIQKNKIYNFNVYDEIYMFFDATLIGCLLNKQKIKYILLEDGTDCFKSKYKNNYESICKKIYIAIRRKILKIFNIYDLAMSPNIKMVEVNDKKDLRIQHENIKECPKKELFKSLNEKEKEKILKIFSENFENISNLSNKNLILTQPLSEDGLCNNESEKIKIYKSIIEEHVGNDNVIIKAHPREKTNYKEAFKNIKNVFVITEKFPLEILGFLNINFEKVITIFSTSINLIENCSQKIELGRDYIERCLKNGD